jgi:predicted NAD/FAD-dependent oxidoreductase
MSKTPAKAIHSLLQVNFAPSVPDHGGKRMTLNSIYSLTVCLDKPLHLLPETFVSGFVHNHKALRFITCQTQKYKQQGHVWTILSSSSFAKRYKAPQEFLPDETIEEVSTLLLQALEEALDIKVLDHVVDRRLQLWGAALPLNVWGSQTSTTEPQGFLYDSEQSVGVCGDWLMEPSIAGAWTSGRLLAEYMMGQDLVSSGLEGSFHRSDSASKSGIGALL